MVGLVDHPAARPGGSLVGFEVEVEVEAAWVMSVGAGPIGAAPVSVAGSAWP